MLKITILHDDITRQDVDAIVNPANSYGFMGGGEADAMAYSATVHPNQNI